MKLYMLVDQDGYAAAHGWALHEVELNPLRNQPGHTLVSVPESLVREVFVPTVEKAWEEAADRVEDRFHRMLEDLRAKVEDLLANVDVDLDYGGIADAMMRYPLPQALDGNYSAKTGELSIVESDVQRDLQAILDVVKDEFESWYARLEPR